MRISLLICFGSSVSPFHCRPSFYISKIILIILRPETRWKIPKHKRISASERIEAKHINELMWKAPKQSVVRGNTWRRACSRWPKAEKNENTNHAVLHLLCRVPQHRYGIEAVKETCLNRFQLYNFRVFLNANTFCSTKIQFNRSIRAPFWSRWSVPFEFICPLCKRNKLWRRCSSVWQSCSHWHDSCLSIRSSHSKRANKTVFFSLIVVSVAGRMEIVSRYLSYL